MAKEVIKSWLYDKNENKVSPIVTFEQLVKSSTDDTPFSEQLLSVILTVFDSSVQ